MILASANIDVDFRVVNKGVSLHFCHRKENKIDRKRLRENKKKIVCL